MCNDDVPSLDILTRARPRRSASSCSWATPREKAPTRPRACEEVASRQRAGLCRKR